MRRRLPRIRRPRRRPPARASSVNSKTRWTPTGLTVRRGETLTFNTTGEVRLSANGDDIAPPAGSTSGRMAVGSPDAQRAGGRADWPHRQWCAVRIGNQTTLVAPAAGQLFLGVNDGDLNDNTASSGSRSLRMSAQVRR